MSDVTVIDTTRPTVAHAGFCEAEQGHAQDCATATRLARLQAFAEAVRDEFQCTAQQDDLDDATHLTDCWQCAALQALEPVR
jgi:uncharacterized membrane protein